MQDFVDIGNKGVEEADTVEQTKKRRFCRLLPHLPMALITLFIAAAKGGERDLFFFPFFLLSIVELLRDASDGR